MSELAVILCRVGLDLRRVPSSTREIVLFGSRAYGCARESSDWDVLVIGARRPRIRNSAAQDLDVVFLDADDERAWLGTELATHVARFGKWVHGAPGWRSSVDGSQAATAKAGVLRRDAGVLMAYWNDLARPRALRYLHRFRRDAQRLALLRRGDAVPPSACLEAAWSSAPVRERRSVIDAAATESGLTGPALQAWTNHLSL